MTPHTPTPMKHTPGPWTASNCGSIIAEAEDICIAVIESDGGYEAEPEQRKANAHLIAAAPALVEALEQMMHRMNLNGHFDDGCFYYNRRSAPELEEPIRLAQAALSAAKPNDL